MAPRTRRAGHFSVPESTLDSTSPSDISRSLPASSRRNASTPSPHAPPPPASPAAPPPPPPTTAAKPAAPYFVPAGSTRYNATLFYMPRGLRSAETRALATRLNKPTEQSGIEPADRIASLRDLHGQKLLALTKKPSKRLYKYVAEPDKPTTLGAGPSRFDNITRRLSGFSEGVRRRTSSFFGRGETRVSQDVIDRATRRQRARERVLRQRRNAKIKQALVKIAFAGAALAVFVPMTRQWWRVGRDAWHAWTVRRELDKKTMAIMNTIGREKFEQIVKGTELEGPFSRAAGIR